MAYTDWLYMSKLISFARNVKRNGYKRLKTQGKYERMPNYKWTSLKLMKKILKQYSNRHKRIECIGHECELWVKSIKHFGTPGRHFPALLRQKSWQHDTCVCRSWWRSTNSKNGACLRSPSHIGTLRSRTGERTTARQRTVRTGPRSPSHAMDK